MMPTLFLISSISCIKLNGIIERLQKVSTLTPIQKNEIILELIKFVPECQTNLLNK